MSQSTCSFDGCHSKVNSRGLCSGHYAQWRTGKPLVPKRDFGHGKTVQERFDCKVTKSDGCWIWHATLSPAGYGQFYYKNKLHMAHRVSWELANGPIPDGMFLDHICHTPACVRVDHLRLATPKQNAEYLSGAHKDNQSGGVRGVCWHAASGKWMARTHHYGKSFYLGLFEDVADAEAAVKAKRAEVFTFPEYE